MKSVIGLEKGGREVGQLFVGSMRLLSREVQQLLPLSRAAGAAVHCQSLPPVYSPTVGWPHPCPSASASPGLALPLSSTH